MADNDKFYVCSVEDTLKYGIYGAAIIGRIRWWCDWNEKKKVKYRKHNGHWWTGHLSAKELSEQTGINVKTIQKHLQILEKQQVIIKDNFNRLKWDKTGWYRVNPSPTIEVTPPPIEDTHLQYSTSMYPNIVHRDTTIEETIPVSHSKISKTTVSPPVSTTVNPSVEVLVSELKPVIVERVSEDAGYLFELYFLHSLTTNQIDKFKKWIPTILEKVPAVKQLNLPSI